MRKLNLLKFISRWLRDDTGRSGEFVADRVAGELGGSICLLGMRVGAGWANWGLLHSDINRECHSTIRFCRLVSTILGRENA